MDVFNLLIFDNGFINYQSMYSVENFLIVPLTFVGLVFINGILSNYISYITQPVLQAESSPFSIAVRGEDWKYDESTKT